jgi:hypothetical protein
MAMFLYAQAIDAAAHAGFPAGIPTAGAPFRRLFKQTLARAGASLVGPGRLSYGDLEQLGFGHGPEPERG